MKQTLHCPACDTLLSVSSSMAGKRVRCSRCKEILEVPPAEEEEVLEEVEEEEYEDEDEEEYEDEYEEEEEQEEARPRKRAGARAGAGAGRSRGQRPGRTAERPRRGPARRRGGGGRPPSSSGLPLPLLLGGAAALLAAVIAVVAIAAGGGGEEEAGPDETEASAQDGDGKAENDEKARLRSRYDELAASAETHEEFFRLGTLAEELGLSSEAREHWNRARTLAEEEGEVPERIYRKLGWKRYDLPDLEDELRNDPELLGELAGAAGSWMSAEKHEALEQKQAGILKAAREELALRRQDPFYAKAREIRKTIENMSGFDKLLFSNPDLRERDKSYPYLVFEHVGRKGQNPYRSEEAKQLMEQKMDALRSVYDYVKKTFLSPLGFEAPVDRPMVVVSLEDRAAFDAYHKDIQMEVPPGALAYFHRKTKFIVMYNGQGRNIYAKEENDSILFHEAVHQILNYFSSLETGGEPLLSHWFNEGCAEFVGSLRERLNPDGSCRYMPAHQMKEGRLREFYMARFPQKFARTRTLGLRGPYALSLEEMVQCVHGSQAMERIFRKWIAQGGSHPQALSGPQRNAVLAMVSSLIYAQATSFYFFCYKGKPELAPKMNRYFQKEMLRRVTYRGAATFKACFGVSDLSALEKEWLDYVDSITTYGIKQGG